MLRMSGGNYGGGKGSTKRGAIVESANTSVNLGYSYQSNNIILSSEVMRVNLAPSSAIPPMDRPPEDTHFQGYLK
jgi:hypothetical protein